MDALPAVRTWRHEIRTARSCKKARSMRRTLTLSVAVSALIASSLIVPATIAASGAGAVSAAIPASAPSVQLEGTFVDLVADDVSAPTTDTSARAVTHDARADMHDIPALKTSDGRLVKLHFARGLAMPAPGAEVTLRASLGSDGSATVSSLSTSGSSGAASASIGSSPAEATKRVAILLVNFLDDSSQPWTAAQVYSSAFGPGAQSLTRFYRDATYGGWQLTGDVFGWYTLPVNAGTGCDVSTWAIDAKSAATAAGVSLAAYTNVVYAFPNRSGCSFAGLAEMPGSQVWLNNQATNIWVAGHELGHNFGLDHAFGLVCTSANGDQIPAAGSCTDTMQDYDDPFDTMGASWYHTLFSAPHRVNLGVLDAGSVATVTASGTYTVVPEASTGSGTRMLRVPSPDGTHLVDIELRASFGLETWMPGQLAVSGVIVRRETIGQPRTDLLNITGYPSRWDLSTVRLGHTLVDALDNLSIRLIDLTGTSATVQIGIGDGADTTPPSVPGNLRGVGTSPTQATLSWTASSDDRGLAGYVVYRNGAKLAQIAPWDASYVDSGAMAATTYTYAVRALDELGNLSGIASIVVTTPASGVLTDTTAPSPVTGLQVVRTSPTSVALAWTRGSDDVALGGDAVYRDGVSLGCGLEGAFFDFGLAPGSTHTYAVYSTDRSSNRSVGTPLTVTLPPSADQSPPGAPGTLSAAAAGGGSVSLAWGAANDDVAVAGYQVSRDAVVIANTAYLSMTDSGLDPGSSHTYAVAAYDASGNVGPAVTATTTPGTSDSVAPSAPGSPSAAPITSSSVTLSWTAATDNIGVAGYRVSRNGALLGTTSSLTYSDDGLAAGTTYVYGIAAFDTAGNVGPQAGVTTTTTAAADTTAPTAPGALHTTSVGSTSVALAWTASTDNVAVAGYRITRNGVQVATTPTLAFSDAGLVAGTTYTYSVSAYDASGNVSSGSSVIATTAASADTAPPSAPANLVATVKGGKVSLRWGASTDNVAVTGYRVWRNGSAIATVAGTSFADNPTRGAWSYWVTALDAAGNVSPASNTVSISR